MQRLIGFGPADLEAIRRVAPRLEPHINRIADRFYNRLLTDPEALSVFTGGPAQMERQRQFLTTWLRATLKGDYDSEFFDRLIRVGVTHVRTGIPQRLMVSGLEIIRQELELVLDLEKVPPDSPERRSLAKALALNLAAMLESYKESYESHIRDDERQAVEEKLTRAEHLAEIGQLAASLAHEIKNPLAGISGAIQVIRETMQDDNPHHYILTEVLGQIRRLDATVKDLMQYARPVPPRLQRCSVGAVVERVMRVLREEPALERVNVKHNGADLDAIVLADENQIEQLLLNLVINAAHASKDGDAIVIAVSVEQNYVELAVTDSGEGMPEGVRARVFEPFFTTKAKGTGLGLSICRRIVDAHGGNIQLESALGTGTTVRVQLPKGRTPKSDRR